MDLHILINKIKEFAEEREWELFHSPKNLSMALSVEASEIVEIFQWLTQEQSFNLDEKRLQKAKDEIADVMIYLLMLSDKLRIDPLKSAEEKIEKNRMNYPVDLAKGKADKYKDL